VKVAADIYAPVSGEIIGVTIFVIQGK